MLPRRLIHWLPFIPCIVGLTIAAFRFRVRDQLGGLVWGEMGMLLMLVLAMRMPER